MVTSDVIAYTASAVTAAVLLPQAIRSWRQRHDGDQLAGVSLWTPALSLTTAVLWITWAVMVDQLPSVAYTVVSVPAALFTLALLTRKRTEVAPGNANPRELPVTVQIATQVCACRRKAA